MCESIAKVRRWAQRISNKHLLVLDESHLHVGESPKHTRVAPGEKQFIVVEENSAYSERYDIIVVLAGDCVLPPIIYGAADRRRLGVEGIRTFMLIDYVEDILARAVSGLDRYPMYLLLDRATCHPTEQLLEAFRSQGCEELVEVRRYPPKAAKRISPLDNSFFHEWKDKCRAQFPITKRSIKSVMVKALFDIPPQHIRAYYRKCGYTGARSPYYDCPEPQQHLHPFS